MAKSTEGYGLYLQDTLKLRHPILISGVERTELPYDFDQLLVDDMLRIDERRLAINTNIGPNQAMDPITQFETFCAAVMKADPTITRGDLSRMKHNDGMTAKARTFLFFGGVLAAAPQPTSGTTSPSSSTAPEETPEITTK